ncbi:MAG: hypothetical protein ACRDYX_20600 [Egibacteraceae bacterium]
MLVIPAPTFGADTLDVLVTDDPAGAGVPAVTPDLAARLLERWRGALLRVDSRDGCRYVRLPLRPAKGRAA